MVYKILLHFFLPIYVGPTLVPKNMFKIRKQAIGISGTCRSTKLTSDFAIIPILKSVAIDIEVPRRITCVRLFL